MKSTNSSFVKYNFTMKISSRTDMERGFAYNDLKSGQ